MTKIKTNSDFLSKLYKGVEMGIYSISNMQKFKTVKTNPEFKEELKIQNNDYKIALSKIRAEILANGKEPKPLCTTFKFFGNFGLWTETVFNKSVSNLAQTLMEGTQMGIVGITKLLKEYENASENLKTLATNLIELEKENMQKLEAYLAPSK